MHKQKIFKINEEQYRFLIGEDLHYPNFLQNLKQEIKTHIYNLISSRIQGKIDDKGEYLYYLKNNKYCDTIRLIITFHESTDIENHKNYTAQYYAEDGNDNNGKIINPMLFLEIPIDYNRTHNKFNASYISVIVSHEVGHLYDDWVILKNGKVQLCLRDEPREIGKLMNIGKANANKYIESIGFLSYLSMRTERQSFISQVYEELDGLNVDVNNYAKIYEKLTSYQNYKKTYDELCNIVNNSDDKTLYDLNRIVINVARNTSIPNMSVNNFDANVYRGKLKKFNQWLYKDFLKRLGGIIIYYINNHSEEPKQQGIKEYYL